MKVNGRTIKLHVQVEKHPNGTYFVSKLIYAKRTGECLQPYAVVKADLTWLEAQDLKRQIINDYTS